MSEHPITYPGSCPVSPLTAEQRASVVPWLIAAPVAYCAPRGIMTILLTLSIAWPQTFDIEWMTVSMALAWLCCWVVEYVCWEQLARIGGREHVVNRRVRWIRLALLTLLFGILLHRFWLW